MNARRVPNGQRIRVGYLTGRAPQPTSTFTNDEIGALHRRVDIYGAGVIGPQEPFTGWQIGPPLRSRRLWRSVVRHCLNHPLLLIGALVSLLGPALTSPRDAVIAFRCWLAACWLADVLTVDLLHAQFAGPAGAAAFVWHRITGRPYTVRVHAYDIYRPYSWVGSILRDAAVVIPISRHGADHVAKRWRVSGQIVRVGIPASHVAPRDRRPPDTPFRLLSVGALHPKKGHDVLIAAVQRAARILSCTLDVYGDGPERSRLERIIDRRRVRLRGWQSPTAMRESFAEYDAFALASRYMRDGDADGIPVVLLEAAAAGLPIIATNVAGIPELIEDGVTGHLCEPTAESVAAAILDVARNYELASHMATRARDRVVQDYDLARSTDKLVSLWESVLQPGFKVKDRQRVQER